MTTAYRVAWESLSRPGHDRVHVDELGSLSVPGDEQPQWGAGQINGLDNHPGIGVAYIDTGTMAGTVDVPWAGHTTNHNNPVGPHIETAPLVNIAPETEEFGFGIWFSRLGNAGVIYATTVGRPGDRFARLGGVYGWGWVKTYSNSGTAASDARTVRLVTDGTTVRAYDGTGGSQITGWSPVTAGDPFGLGTVDAFTLPDVLVGRSVHGVALDSHLSGTAADRLTFGCGPPTVTPG